MLDEEDEDLVFLLLTRDGKKKDVTVGGTFVRPLRAEQGEVSPLVQQMWERGTFPILG